MYDRENEASLAVLPDLLKELDSMTEVCIYALIFPSLKKRFSLIGMITLFLSKKKKV